MSKKKDAERSEAIRLRVEERLGLADISLRLNVSKTSCSMWLRDYPLSPDEIAERQALAPLKPLPIRSVEWVQSPVNAKGSHVTRFNGEKAMLRMQLRAAELGMTISRPTTEVRYDAIVDNLGKLTRVQVKYCNCIRGDGACMVRLDRRGQSYSVEEVDAVVVYVPMQDKLYWLPISMCEGKKTIMLRFRSSRNRQTIGINFAEQFEW